MFEIQTVEIQKAEGSQKWLSNLLHRELFESCGVGDKSSRKFKSLKTSVGVSQAPIV